jgi:GTP-binding protein
MKITSAKFMRGIAGTDELLEDGKPQIALIGRSNVGKSSIINSLTGQKALARMSDTPGLTQEINIYSINNKLYLLDMPGYGFAKVPEKVRERLQKLVWWYLFDSGHEQRKAMLVVDANTGPSKNDLEMLAFLRDHQKNIVIVANKIDKIKKSEYVTKMEVIEDFAHGLPVIPYSSKTKTGVEAVLKQFEA